MQRYRWPGYEMLLLEELQRQQNRVQFCDTLLQTEGVSVPSHSCVLAALSPYLSQKLSACPSPPSGQRRQLRLQAVKAQTLLKLVGLLYTGRLEVKGSREQNDVLAAARRFGITDLVEGWRDGGMEEGQLQEKRQSVGSYREVGFHGLEKQDAQVQVEMTQREENSCPVRKRSCVSTGTQTVEAGEKSVGGSVILSGQSGPPPTFCGAQSEDCFMSFQPQNITIRVSSTGETTFGRTNPTPASASSSGAVPFPVPLDDESSSPIGQEDDTYLEDLNTNGKMADCRDDAEQQSQDNGDDEMCGEENGNSAVKRHEHAGMKRKMQQVMETTPTSVKVKLRRTKGEVWEVVRMQGSDETLSARTSLRQCPLQKPAACHRRPAAANSPRPPTHSDTGYDSQPLSVSSFTPNQSSELELEPLPPLPPRASVEDEQIERLLEDIMMGLNILPGWQRDRKKPRPSHDGATAVRRVVAVTGSDVDQSRMQTAVGEAEGVLLYQGLETQSSRSSTDTAQNQPSSTSHESVRSLGQNDEMSCYSVPPPKSQNSRHPEASTPRSAMPSSFFSSGKKLRHPECQEPSSQEDERVPDFLPLSESQGDDAFPLSCLDDLRLPPCLSPLEPVNPDDDVQQQQTSLHWPPWLSGSTASLQFPFNTVTCRKDEGASQPLAATKRRVGTWAESCTVNTAVEIRTKPAAELESDHVEVNQSGKPGDGTGGATAPRRRKRRRTKGPQDAANSCLACEDGTKSFCSLRLSSNNVLVRETEMAACSSNVPHRFVETANESLIIRRGVREKTRRSEVVSGGQRRIRTRGFVKKSQEMPSSTIPAKSSVLVPVVCRAKIVRRECISVPTNKRGRPPKKELQERSPDGFAAFMVNSCRHVEREQEIGEEKTKERFRKHRKTMSEVEKVPPKCTAEVEADVRKHEAARRPRLVSLNEFRKLIKQSWSKTQEQKEIQETTNESAKETETKTPKVEDDDVFGVTVEKNLNQLFRRSDEPNVSGGEEDGLCGDGDRPASPWNVPEEEADRSSTEREHQDEGGSDAVQSTITGEDSAHRGAHLPQENKMALDHGSHLQTPEKTGSMMPDADETSKTSGCDQEEEEDEEEVDILLFSSPEKVAQTTVCEEDGLSNMDITADEEEEEGAIEIDVTGDEAE